MPLNSVTLSVALAPTFFSTWLLHLRLRKAHEETPAATLSYNEGVHLLREFIACTAKYTVEDLQDFTRQHVPSPYWVRTENITIPCEHLSAAAAAVTGQLGPKGISRVGGKEWWQWRGISNELKGEWVEMRRDYSEREQAGTKCRRIILYIHGGAFYFGSIETHRYQLQRHARKLKGRVFARILTAAREVHADTEEAEYRLSPQFPFPCGLQDCLAAYYYLLDNYEPGEIIFAGDSAGGGLVFSMLVIIRDQGLPLPAGAILISPWVDLTHSFPSIMSHNPGDYLPPCGLRHRPSQAWPAPSVDEIAAANEKRYKQTDTNRGERVAKESAGLLAPQDVTGPQEDAAQIYSASERDLPLVKRSPYTQAVPEAKGKADNITVKLDGQTIEIKEQIQMYAANHLLTHPLVSPVLQPSLGGLPPLFILVGGGEMLRDEQFYIAHKAASPIEYAPSEDFLNEYDLNREILNRYPPTYVHLQVWDNLCHAAPTLGFTTPAKHMYRAIAQFGAWALTRAQSINASDLSKIDQGLPSSGNLKPFVRCKPARVGRAGDPLPAFCKHMIRQRVSENGYIYPLDPISTYAVLQIPPSQIGIVNPHVVKRWITGRQEWDEKFAKERLHMQQQRINRLAHGLDNFCGESPPPGSLAARRPASGVPTQQQNRSNYFLLTWKRLVNRDDRQNLQRKKVKVANARQTTGATGVRTTSKLPENGPGGQMEQEKPRSIG